MTGIRYRGTLDFQFGGGGWKDFVGAHTSQARSPLWPGFRARLRALEALGVCGALSCYLSLILSILMQNGI